MINLRPTSAAFIAVALLLPPVATTLRAQTPALDFSELGRGFDYIQGSYTLGWRFHTNADVSVTALGFYDDLKDGIHGSRPVGIYDVQTRELLASTSVTPADPLTGFFRYHDLPAPVTLPAGRDYYAMALNGGDRYAVGVSELTVNPAITFTGFAGTDPGDSSQSVLRYPVPSQDNPGFHGDFGPGFLLTTTPAPASSSAAAVDFGSLGAGSDVNQAAFSMGYRFQPTKDVQVATVGYYDDAKNGFKQSHGVVIFDAITKAIVLNSQVTNADPLRGFFRYHAVAPVTLSASREYFLMGDNSADNYARDVSGLTVNPAVALKGGAFNPNPPTLGPDFPTQTDAGTPFFGPTFEIVSAAHPAFFKGEAALGNNTYYLNLPDGTPFGYYGYLPQDQNYVSHQDLGYEYVTDAKDGKSGVYLYDFASQGFFYTSPSFPFPYLYDFSLNTTLYYYPDTNNAGRYTSNPRYFYNFATGKIITK